MGRAAKLFAEGHFTADIIVPMYESLYYREVGKPHVRWMAEAAPLASMPPTNASEAGGSDSKGDKSKPLICIYVSISVGPTESLRRRM